MLSSLVISSSSNAVKFSSLFRSLAKGQGVEVSFLILDHNKDTDFTPFEDHRMYHQGVVHYLNPRDNTVSAHEENYQQTEKFCQRLRNYFLSDIAFKKTALSSFTETSSAAPIEMFDKNDVLDLKYAKNLKNIQLEIKNKGLISFDHLFVEQTDSCLEFVQAKSSDLVSDSEKSELVWVCYNYKLSADLAREDFWFLESNNYHSIFDNCYYLQPRGQQLRVWALIPHHQYLNQQYHQDFQDRTRKKIEAKFGFVTLSFLNVSEMSIHLMNSQRLQLKSNHRVSGYPCFSFYSNENVHEWFGYFSKEFNKKHKIKTADVKG